MTEGIVKGALVEWTPGGLARVDSEPFTRFGRTVVRILPLRTGDWGEGLYTREYPLDRLSLADMALWHYDARRNLFVKEHKG